LELPRLHRLDVVVTDISHRIRYLAGSKTIEQSMHGVLDGVGGLEAEITPDLFRRDVVGTVVVAPRGHDFSRASDDRTDHLVQLQHRVVLIARVENLAGNLV